MKHRIWRDLPTEQVLRNGGLKEKKILDAVTQYHAVRKDLLANIYPRIAKLLRVIDACKKSGAGGLLGSGSGGLLGKMGKAMMDQSVASVMKRATAKIAYLNVLDRHYNVSNPDEILDPTALIAKLEAAQQTADGGKLLGIAQHENLEKLDPVHRSWGDNDKIHGDTKQYVSHWLMAVREGSCNEPFFIYLEDTPHCRDAAEAKKAITVVYHSQPKGEIPVWYLKDLGGQLRQVHPVTQTNNPFDTQWMKKAHSGKGGYDKTLAYIFTVHKELIADLHSPGSGGDTSTFHHSSFNSGDLVRCAGMIGGREGKVVYIDSASGHYQPPRENLKRLVRHLNKRSLFAPDAKVESRPPGEQHAVRYSVADFLAL